MYMLSFFLETSSWPQSCHFLSMYMFFENAPFRRRRQLVVVHRAVLCLSSRRYYRCAHSFACTRNMKWAKRAAVVRMPACA